MRSSYVCCPGTLLVATFVAVLVPSTAHAQDEVVVRDADVAFTEGRNALARGDLLQACARFADSDRLLPSGRASLNLADCLERRGHLADAYRHFLEAASRAVQAGRADAERHARDRAAHLEPRLGRITLAVPAESDVPGLAVTHDGTALPASAWNAPELVDPGTTHVFEATAPGHHWRGSVTATAGSNVRLEVRWDETAPPAPLVSAAPGPALPPRSHSRFGALPPLAYAAFGAGAAGLVVGVVGGIVVLSAKSTVQEHCAVESRVCDEEGASAASRGSTWSVVAPLAIGAGLASIAVGTWLSLRTPRVVVSPTASGLVAAGSF